jgi:hypothetical protein
MPGTLHGRRFLIGEMDSQETVCIAAHKMPESPGVTKIVEKLAPA